jgi:uncharacterized protein (TIGR03000 family)
MLKRAQSFRRLLLVATALALGAVLPNPAAAQVGTYPSGLYPSYAYPYYPAYRPSVSAIPGYSSAINRYNGYIPGNTYRPGFDPGFASSYARIARSVTPPRTGQSRFYIPSAIEQEQVRAATDSARLEVIVPSDAALWFNGWKAKSTGPVRQFQSPPLSAGHKYTYTVEARWEENGRPVMQTRQVIVSAGGFVRVDFSRPADAGDQAKKNKER